MRAAVVVAACAACAALLGCSSSTGSSAQSDGGTPPGQPRSFRRDVVPIFAESCASQDCHGDTKNTMLGIHFVPSDPDGLYAELQRESPTAKGVKFVEPGDPTRSFLFAKINGDEGDYTPMCAPPDCGETMPPGTKIASAQRDTIRQWILEGATKD